MAAAFSYGTSATTFGKNPTDSYYALAGGGGGSAAQWATFPAVGDVDMSGNKIDNATTITCTTVNANDVIGITTLSLGPSATPSIDLVSTAPGPSSQFGQTTSTGFIVAKDGGGTIRGPQVQFDALNDRTRWISADGTAPLLDISSPAPGSSGVVVSFATTTVGRPVGDVAVDGLLQVQNGSGNGIALRADAAAVAGGGTIERVAAGVPSDVPDITIDASGDVSIAQDLSVIGTLTLPTIGQQARAPIFNMRGGGGVTCSVQSVINGVPQNVANPLCTAGTIIHLTPVSSTPLTVPLSYTINPGVGFTLYNDNAAPVTIAWSIHSYDYQAFGP